MAFVDNAVDVGKDFIQPLKSQGVLETDDYGLVVRAKFMCKPGRQWLIRRYALWFYPKSNSCQAKFPV